MRVLSVLVHAMLVLGMGCLVASTAVAQPDRLAEELALTDRRIELAESVVQASGDASARQELGMAIDLQQRARAAATANQPVIALRLTREARIHADRATAIVRGLPDPDRVVAQVERTRDLLDRARERIEVCDDARARNLIRVAAEMQTRAEAALREVRYVAALQLTLSAQGRLFRALRACRLEETAQEGASRALGRTQEVLDRARAAVDANASAAATQALARAESIQSEASAEFRAQRYEAAMRMTLAARAIAHRALRLSMARSSGR